MKRFAYARRASDADARHAHATHTFAQSEAVLAADRAVAQNTAAPGGAPAKTGREAVVDEGMRGRENVASMSARAVAVRERFGDRLVSPPPRALHRSPAARAGCCRLGVIRDRALRSHYA